MCVCVFRCSRNWASLWLFPPQSTLYVTVPVVSFWRCRCVVLKTVWHIEHRQVYSCCILVYKIASTRRETYFSIFKARSQNCEKRILASSCLSARKSARTRGTTRFPLDGFSWKLIFEYFSKIYGENSSFVKIWQNFNEFLFYMETNIHFWAYLVQFFFWWEIRQKLLRKSE